MAETSNQDEQQRTNGISIPPRGLAILMVLGPGLVWCGEYIGSGEVILATRTGAVLGLMVLWVPTLAIFAKFWIGLAGAHYTVCTGEGMIDMMSRTPGPRNWAVWIVFVVQLITGAVATSALASSAGIFAAYFIPWPPKVLGWIISLSMIALVWSGKFSVLKQVSSILVGVIIIGVADVSFKLWPGWGGIFSGLCFFQVPAVPDWAQDPANPVLSPWHEILPLLGWAAGGFASQVWYTYWVMGADYGMTKGRGWGKPLDADTLRAMTPEDARRVKGWCRVVTWDAIVAVIIGIVVTAAFFIAGAGVLGPAQIAPKGEQVALDLARIFGENWGVIGERLFMLAGLAAMVSTLLGQFAGWPRLLSDCGRLLIPGVAKYPWKVQFRTVLIVYAISNLVIIYTFGLTPVKLIKTGATMGGLLLTPIQTIAVGLTFYLVMPKYFTEEVRRILRPHWVIALGLLLAFFMFGYFCVFEFPREVSGLLST